MSNSMTDEENGAEAKPNADDEVKVAERPLKALHHHCLDCCNGSASEVRHCPAISCPLFPYRFGRKPTAEMLAEVGGRKVYPFEDGRTVAEFGGTVLQAIKQRCLDCSGNSKAEVRNCRHITCELHAFRFGRNPNRRLGPDQRRSAAARRKANISRKRNRK
jgi:hypothetical protein